VSRVCTCGTILSRYNDEPLCGPCRVSERERIAAQLEAIRELPEAVQPYTPPKPPPVPGSVMAKALEAMPGTANDIAEAVGHPLRKTSRLLTKLVHEGRATVDGDKGNGHTGPLRTYRRVERTKKRGPE
jgi:hypothetical protein